MPEDISEMTNWWEARSPPPLLECWSDAGGPIPTGEGAETEERDITDLSASQEAPMKYMRREKFWSSSSSSFEAVTKKSSLFTAT